MPPPLGSARRVAFIYLAVAILWIAATDLLLGVIVSDSGMYARLSTLKGWVFVGASAALIWWLVGREVRRLRHAKERFSSLAEQGIAGFYVLDGGRFVYSNSRLAEIVGYTPEQLVGRSPLDLAVADDRERLVEVLRDAGNVGAARIRHEFRAVRSDGRQVPVEVIGRQVMWEGRSCIAGVLIDVSDRAELASQLRQAIRLEAVGLLTGAVVHDFNNLLTGILGQLDLAMMDLPSDSPAAHDIQLASATVRRAGVLTRKLLAFTRTQVHRPKAVDPNHALREMAGLLRTLTPSPVRLHLELGAETPHVLLDPSDFDQTVMNLYINATQAIEGEGEIRIRTESSDGSFTLEVTDTGSGMDEAMVARIFDPFFTTKRTGTGLGLATVRRIVEEAEGRVDVESRDGGGTTFRIALPAAAPLLVRPDGSVPETHRPPFRRSTILVVDDDPTVRKVMNRALTRAGHTVLAARDGETALERIDEDPEIELLLIDVSLPRMSGLELVEEALQRRSDLLVIFTSGYTPADLEVRQPLLDRHPFLEKPFSVEGLLKITADTLARPGGPQKAVSA